MKMYPCGERNIPTDYFYAELTCDWDKDGDGIIGERWSSGGAMNGDEIERYFEVYVGRIPHYGVMADTDAILQKTIDYETATDTAWRRKVLISNVPIDSNVHGYDWGDQVKRDLLEPKAISSDRAYRNGYGHTVSDYNLIPPPEFSASAYPATVWSQGQYGLHVWSTHGSKKEASGIISSGDAANLDDNHPATVFQSSCRNAWPTEIDNLSYALLKQGAILTLGATRNSYYSLGQHEFSNSPSNGGMGYRYAKGISEGKSCGEALWGLKEETSSWWTHNWTLFNPYGDPSVVVMPSAPAFIITPTDAFYSKQYDGETLIPESRTYTLENNDPSALTWTASKTASWFDLSSYAGSIPANGSVAINATLNSGIESLPQGTHGDTITFTDTTHAKTLLRDVDFVLSTRVPRTEYEAEDAAYAGPAFANNRAGYSGTGYVDYLHASGDYIEWPINAASDGPYTLAFRYALLSGDRPLEVKVDGQVVRASLGFPSTGSWTRWEYTAEVVVALAAGSHTVRATAIGDSGANVDLLRVYDGLNLEDIDAYARGGSYADDNFGSAATLDVKNQGVDSSYTRESYLRFNYNYSDPDPIQSVNLILTPSYLQAGGDASVITVRLLDDADDGWVENEITYNNRPQGTGLETTFVKADLQVGVPCSIDVAVLLEQAMNSNKVASFQIIIDGAYHVVFHSQEATDPTVRPVLELQVVDGDMDGMPDLWEEQYFTNGTAALPGGNPDGDGYDNLEEYIAGTDPTNTASFFHMEGFVSTNAPGIVIEWGPSVAGRLYRPSWAASLTNTFVPLAPDDLESPINSYTDTVHQAEAKGFYRVDVRLK